VVVPGANAELDLTDVVRLAVGAGDVVVAQLETPAEVTSAAFERARGLGAVTLFNPAPAAPIAPALLAMTDVLVVNEHEHALVVAGAPTFGATVVTTLGADGVRVDGSDPFRITGEAVDAVDSTGAGDCFVGYLAAGIAQGRSLHDAVERANRAASISVTRFGAASSIPTAAELG
jgi:ribokinase